MNYNKLTYYFLFGGPVRYHNKRCHVVGMNDILKTVTLELNQQIVPDIKPKEVDKYDETEASKQEDSDDGRVQGW